MADIQALLIGIDFYYPNPLPEGIYYPMLGGCVRDISQVESYLLNRANVPAENIIKLTASETGVADPPEAAGDLATRPNIIAKFRQLAAMAEPGDQAYIHYSGHGGRAKTVYPKLKGDDGLDEALVPPDIGKPGGQYLRDVELGYLLQELVDKGLYVTIVLDSCHSGGATRGRLGPLDAVTRGVKEPDLANRPADTLVAPLADLMQFWQQASSAKRGVKAASGWLLEPQGYVLFAACRESESAYEYAADGKERSGALTYWLLDSLRNAGPGYSYQMLSDRIVAKVHGQFEQQTPTVQGEGDRVIFGGKIIAPYFAANVLEVDGQRVRIFAGEAQIIAKDDYFTIYPNTPGIDFTQADQRLAVVKVEEVEDVECWAVIEQDFGHGEVSEGDQAVYLPSDNIHLQRKVGLLIQDASLRQKVVDAIQQQGQNFVAVAQADDTLDFQVDLDETGQNFVIWDAAGTVISVKGKLVSALPVADAGSLSVLVSRLVHIAKFRNVQALNAPDTAKGKLIEVKLTADTPAAVTTGDVPPPTSAADKPLNFHVGDKMKLTIKNILPPIPGNESQNVLNITVLTTDSDYSVSQLYPTKMPFASLDPGKSIELPFGAFLPEGQSESDTTFMIFATARTSEFRWLQLPPLDQPTKPRGAFRGNGDALTQLLASVTDEKASTRAVSLLSSPEDEQAKWVVERKPIHVAR